MLSDERLAEIQARADKATPGPWRWQEDRFREKYMQRMRNGNWRARPGRNSRDSWVMLLTGPVRWARELTPEEEERFTDEWDYPHIFALRWGQVRGTSLFNATPTEADAAFIAHARTDVADLLAEIQRLRAELAFSSLNPSTNPSNPNEGTAEGRQIADGE